MLHFGEIPEGAKMMSEAPPLSMIATSNKYPAYLRIAATELMNQPYATVGSVLSSMNIDDIMDVLESWLRTLTTASQKLQGEMENVEPGKKVPVLFASSSGPFMNFSIFCAIVAKAEGGETKFNPAMLGLQVDLMQSFMKAYVLKQTFKDVNLDLPSLSLSTEFLRKNFDAVLNTQNYTVMKYVKDITAHWKVLRDSDSYKHLMHGEPKKDDEVAKRGLGYSSDALRKALGNLPGDSTDNGLSGLPTPEIQPKMSPKTVNPTNLADFEAKLRRDLGL